MRVRARSGEDVREPIREDQGRHRLRVLLLEGVASPAGAPADVAYFDRLRRRAQRDIPGWMQEPEGS
jgi:hypothetical protein